VDGVTEYFLTRVLHCLHMRLPYFVIASVLAVSFVAIGNMPLYAASMDHTRGSIVIQVEDHGEAWYVLPTATERVYIKNGEAAYAALRNFGLGISNADIWEIPVGISPALYDDAFAHDADRDGLSDTLEEALGTNSDDADSDSDGYADAEEIEHGYSPVGSATIPVNEELVDRLRGYILLQVESRGEAWYVNPVDGKRYYMGNGDEAYKIMYSQSLGITNNDLSYIPVYSGALDCDESIDCMIGSIEAFTDFEGVVVSDISLFGAQIQTWTQLAYSATRGEDGRYSWTWTALRQIADGVEQTEVVGMGQSCKSNYSSDLIDLLEEAKLGNYSTNGPSTVICTTFEAD
jgi:hypothetical protein